MINMPELNLYDAMSHGVKNKMSKNAQRNHTQFNLQITFFKVSEHTRN